MLIEFALAKSRASQATSIAGLLNSFAEEFSFRGMDQGMSTQNVRKRGQGTRGSQQHGGSDKIAAIFAEGHVRFADGFQGEIL
jgi:hypothetical protein